MKEISVNNKIISTEIGEVEIKALKSSKTRVSLEFALNSEEYEFMGFDNPVLIDSKGIEHGLSSLYFSGDEGGNNRNIDFQGEIKDENVTLKYDGIYYARRDNRKITIDLLNKKIEDNNYGIELESIEGDIINLKAKDTNDFSFKVEGGVFHKISGSVRQVEGKAIESGVKLGIVDKERETLELYLDYILRDKTKGVEFKLN